ncbi:MAG TPA: T9SS type A sorting domain-containing protein [Bacteroidota bacterium]|nr:T9SS type A sorting domain-containing protein [Bacteroidota bacterium]
MSASIPDSKEPQREVVRKTILARLLFVFMGIASTLWFLIRVIPKPSRATYPCMRAAAPVMSAFFIYVLGLATSLLAFKKARRYLLKAKYAAAFVLLLVSLVAAFVSFTDDAPPVYADSKSILGPNQPIGVPRGINPGRVIWVWDPTSTNENCTNAFGDGWFMPKNTNVDVVSTMMSDAVLRLTGQSTLVSAWDALFRSFNQRHGKGNVGYAADEKIFIKTNQVSASSGTYNTTTFEILNQSRYGMAETSPQAVLVLLRQLVNVVGVKQENISVGDPMKHMYKHVFDMWHNEFPNVVYIDADARLGRTAPVPNPKPVIYYSDRGTVLMDNGTSGVPFTADNIPTVVTAANYLIIVPALKAHSRAGVSLCGKIHYGTNLVGSATHLHGGLIAPNNTVSKPDPLRRGYGSYRTQVDLMGHKDLGEKTVLFIVDGLWGGSESNDPPRKFSMSPFNKDWTSSIFMSQDQVALESVCYDFLKAEFVSTNPYGSYPQIEGSDDHILQAADSSYWPKGIRYDPENDGTVIGSLGVCEHWNNAIDKQYSRNLQSGSGIELVFVNRTITAVRDVAVSTPTSFSLLQNYPNPFNPNTVISYRLPTAGFTTLKIFDIRGREVATLVHGIQGKGEHEVMWDAHAMSSGAYFYRLSAGDYTQTRRMIVNK